MQQQQPRVRLGRHIDTSEATSLADLLVGGRAV